MAPRSTPQLSDARTKHYYRIGEVASLLGVEPHVLRYWEREFRSIRPTKSTRGQRVYSRRDVEELQRVRALLYEEGFTIAGAKKKLESREIELAGDGRGGEPKATLFDPDPPAATAEDAGPAETHEASAAAPAQLDTGSADRIESFLRGVEEALAEARAALAILEKHPR